jgi:imidazolonepropionase-like amidohydrolase
LRQAVAFGPLLLLLLAAATSGAAQTAGTVALINVNIVPMDSERVLMRHTVVIQGDRIISVDPADEAALPRGTRRIEADGGYLVPGFIDAHARLLSDHYIDRRYLDHELAVLVAHGITTLRHAEGHEELLRLREQVPLQDLLAPMLYVSSPPLASLEVAGERAGAMVQTPFEAAAAVRTWRQEGYDFVAAAFGNTAEVWQGIVLTARGSRMPLVGRVPAAVDLQQALESGQQIEYLDGYMEALIGRAGAGGRISGAGFWDGVHGEALERVDEGRIEEVARATVDAETWNIPMLAAVRTALGGAAADGADAAQRASLVSGAVRQALRRELEDSRTARPEEPDRRRYLELRDRLVRALDRAGAKLMAGSGDPAWSVPYGAGLHDELAALAEAGLPRWAALRAATAGPAGFLSFRGGGRAEYATVHEGGIRFTSAVTAEVDFGRLEVGMRADLVLLAANPLDDIDNVRRIRGVMLRGRWLPREELDDILLRAGDVLGQAPLRDSEGAAEQPRLR